MEIVPDQRVFLMGHRGGVAQRINCVVLRLAVALSADDMEDGKTEPLMLVIPADYAQKVVASIQQSLSRLRQAH